MGRSGVNSNLLVLKLGCICFCLLSLLSLTPGFRPAHSHISLRDCVALLNAIIFAAGFYGVQRRARLTWRLGWFVGGFLLSEWLVLCLEPILWHPKPKGWVAAAVMVAGGFAVALYWGYLVEEPGELLRSRIEISMTNTL
jgi:hypothetical protein